MYRHILVPVENGPADRTILEHVKILARLTGARLLLVHVADGWVARNQSGLNLADSEEMKNDRACLERYSAELREAGFVVTHELALGEPSKEIVKLAAARDIDLIAMATHGHRLIGDLVHGSTADKVRHAVDVPVLLLKAKS